MPGYLTDPASYAAGIAISASGNISAPNVQEAIYELDSEKAPATGIAQSAVTNLVSDLSTKAPLASPTFTGTMSASVANISSNLTVDTNTLFVDSSNNRVGIGTNSPSNALTVFTQNTNAEDTLAHIYSDANPSGTSKTSIKIEKGTGYGGIISGYLAQGAGSGLIFSTINGGSINERMRVDSSGRVTMPNQPIFSSRGGNNPVNIGSVIVYGTVDVNVGSHYNSTNGRFTAPVSGNYFFSFHGLLANGNISDSRLAICKNGGGVSGFRFILDKSDASWNTIQGFGILQLAANDFVTIQLDTATQMHTDSAYDGFMGYLLG